MSRIVDTQLVLSEAQTHLKTLKGHSFDLLTLSKPVSPDAALNLAKVISKLSPLLGNLIEFNVVEYLNDKEDFKELGTWKRQDPGFPDAIFSGSITPQPGFEIKAWFPLATEITARFKDSQNHFTQDNINIAMLAWVPSHLIYGQPYILDICVVSGKSVAESRDNHYHNPPDYLVLEPEDTSARTANLQQTNTNGYKFQGSAADKAAAELMVLAWGEGGKKYKPTPEYQQKLRTLFGRYTYRLDTNFAKIDRIVHPGIEAFKKTTLAMQVNGMKISEWSRLLGSENDTLIRQNLKKHLEIGDEDATQLVV
jgi:hypothetical protein